MSDYIRREAALEAFENADADVYEDYGDGTVDWGFGRKNIQNVINGIPAADVAEVVRCKDCKHKLRTVANGVVICREKHGMVRPSLDDFCSYGEYQTNTGGSNNVAD